MTEFEKRFLELELEVWLRKLRKEKETNDSLKPAASGFDNREAWLKEIERTGVEYFKEAVYSGLGCLVLVQEKLLLFGELKQIMRRAGVKEALRRILFEDMDVQKLKTLSTELRSQAETVIREYQSHTEREDKNGE